MSLQVWLPLTKDLRQQGLATVTSTGTPVFKNSGKLGNQSLDLNTRITFNCPAMANKSTFSVAFWAKVNTDTSLTTNWVDVIGFTDQTSGGSNGQLRWETCYASVYETRGISSHDNATNATSNSFGSIIGTTKGIWYHIACTVDIDNNVINEYRNGEVVHTIIPNGGHLTGAFWIGETGKINGEIQDVRIYDHALSQMEVKELAKGLILHYPLNRQGWGQENLGNFASVVSNWTMEGLSGSNYTDSSYGNVIKLVTSSTYKRMYNYVPASMWQSGKIYTVSFLAKADANGRTCDMSRSIADFSPTFTLTTNWKRYNGRITSTATPNGGTLSFRIHDSGATVYITQIKVEEGELATPYCPHYSESLYTTMGLNGITEYDCSGFCNNGTRTGTFSWTSDTPKYQVSTKFSQSRIQCNGDFLYGLSTATLSAWVKLTAYHSERCMVIYANGRYLTINNSGQLSGYSYGKTPAGYYNSNQTIPLNTWTYITIVWDDTTWYFYINGILVNSWACTGTFTNVGNYVSVGQESNGGRSVSGLISDARVYATALSADDVKSLYQNSAYIDSSGNVYGAVHSEV